MTNTSKIYLWRYREHNQSFRGYHLTADDRGVETLVREFRQIATKSGRNEMRIPLQVINEGVLSVPNNVEGNSTAVSFSEWKIILDRSLEQRHFSLNDHHPCLKLEVSLMQLYKVQAGVEAIARGDGDYYIGGKGDNVLWFWWYGG
ncbi:hypothetical protein L0244_10410 [bacterium]|nr:hypothetical protein [bacterium]